MFMWTVGSHQMVLALLAKRSTEVGSNRQFCSFSIINEQRPLSPCLCVRMGRCVCLCQTLALAVPVWGALLVLANSVWSYLLCFMFLASRGAQAALCGQEVAGLTPDRPMQLFTTVSVQIPYSSSVPVDKYVSSTHKSFDSYDSSNKYKLQNLN